MKALAEAGHEVTVVSHFPNDEPIDNYKDESLHGATDGMKNFVNLEVSFKIFSIILCFLMFLLLTVVRQSQAVRSFARILYVE